MVRLARRRRVDRPRSSAVVAGVQLYEGGASKGGGGTGRAVGPTAGGGRGRSVDPIATSDIGPALGGIGGVDGR